MQRRSVFGFCYCPCWRHRFKQTLRGRAMTNIAIKTIGTHPGGIPNDKVKARSARITINSRIRIVLRSVTFIREIHRVCTGPGQARRNLHRAWPSAVEICRPDFPVVKC